MKKKSSCSIICGSAIEWSLGAGQRETFQQVWGRSPLPFKLVCSTCDGCTKFSAIAVLSANS